MVMAVGGGNAGLRTNKALQPIEKNYISIS
jgi:hypothetical protein